MYCIWYSAFSIKTMFKGAWTD